jgi:hypothetical protein
MLIFVAASAGLSPGAGVLAVGFSTDGASLNALGTAQTSPVIALDELIELVRPGGEA